MRASSAGDLIRRQARTRSSPAVTSRLLFAARVTRSRMKKRVVGSTARAPAGSPCSAAASSSNGFSSSFHARTSALTLRVSRIEGSSKNGVTMTGCPCAGISAAVVRSERHQCTPVKYSSEEPASTSSAAALCCGISACSFSSRARCSAALMGWAVVLSDLSLRALSLPAAAATVAATDAAAAEAPTKARRVTLVMDTPADSSRPDPGRAQGARARFRH